MKPLFIMIIIMILSSSLMFSLNGEDVSNGKTRIAVIDFSSKGEIAGSPYLAEAIVEHLITALIDSQEYAVVERSRLKDVMRELRLQDSDDFNDNLRLRIGELYNAEIIVLGSLTKIGDRYTINVRGIDAETGVAIFGKNLDTYSKESLVDLVPKIVALITGQSTEKDVNKELKDMRKKEERVKREKERERREEKRQEMMERKRKNINVLVNYNRIFQISMYVCSGFAIGLSIPAFIGWVGYFFPSEYLVSSYDTTTTQAEKVEAQEDLKRRMLNVAIGFSIGTGVCVVGIIVFAVLNSFKFSQNRVLLNQESPMICLTDKVGMWVDIKAGPGSVAAEIKFSL